MNTSDAVSKMTTARAVGPQSTSYRTVQTPGIGSLKVVPALVFLVKAGRVDFGREDRPVQLTRLLQCEGEDAVLSTNIHAVRLPVCVELPVDPVPVDAVSLWDGECLRERCARARGSKTSVACVLVSLAEPSGAGRTLRTQSR